MKRPAKARTDQGSKLTKDQSSELKAISDSVTAYYDSLTDEEVEENRLWGEFAASQMSDWTEPDAKVFAEMPSFARSRKLQLSRDFCMNDKDQEPKIVFTPDDEPYLGLKSLLAFDQLIIACMQSNALVAPRTHKITKDDLQWAACQIIPAGVSLALSIRELVRQGYLYGALVLLRPLTERAVTMLYLQRFPHKVDIWTKGWKHGKRPTLAQMLNQIGGTKFPNCGPEMTSWLNSLSHGDPDSAAWNLVNTGEGSVGHAPSKILNRPDLCDKISLGASAWTSVLLAMTHALFPESNDTQQTPMRPVN
jgi:hypothetical protein